MHAELNGELIPVEGAGADSAPLGRGLSPEEAAVLADWDNSLADGRLALQEVPETDEPGACMLCWRCVARLHAGFALVACLTKLVKRTSRVRARCLRLLVSRFSGLGYWDLLLNRTAVEKVLCYIIWHVLAGCVFFDCKQPMMRSCCSVLFEDAACTRAPRSTAKTQYTL